MGTDSTTWLGGNQTLQDRLADTGRTTFFADAEDPDAEPLALGVDFAVGEAVVPGEQLGAGAMGEVWTAHQGSLQRVVALKTVKPGPGAAVAARLLVREARICARLEHPNIVPIHMLGQDHQGQPALVMKRVEGVPLDLLVALPADQRPPLDGVDRQEQHLRLLLVVCNAVGYAHSRGVLHRDLKPENVMVGAHGEVYVLDWGLAVTLEAVAAGDRTGWRAGTPIYIAPEAARGEPPTVATDVYLLGGLLYYLLSGGAPHSGDSLPEVLASAERAEPPDPGPGVWPGLAAICRRALAREPAQRYADVESFRAALAGVLRDRSAHELAAVAWRRWSQVTAQGDALDDAAFDAGLAQARYAFRAALDIQPRHEDALEGLQACLGVGIRRALAAGHWKAASLLLQELPREDPVLSGRVQAARDQAESLADQVDALQLALEDGRVDRALNHRVQLSLALTGTFVGLPLVAWWGERTGRMPYDGPQFLRYHLLAWAGLGWLVWRHRASVMPTRAMARMVLGVWTMVVSMWIVRVAFQPFALSELQTLAINLAVVGTVCLALAASVEVALLGPAVAFFIGTFIAAARPDLSLLTMVGVNVVSAASYVSVVWYRDRARP